MGDSFAADWTVKYPDKKGWPNLLAENYRVTNKAQAGCSEYKIWLQLVSEKLENYSHVIMSHTSPYRIPVKQHPIHKDDPLHRDCDLIYSDVKQQEAVLSSVIDFFENYFDIEYAVFVHELIINKELNHLKDYTGRVIHLTNFNWEGMPHINDLFSFDSYFKKHRGLMNHFDDQGNELVLERLTAWIEQ